MWPKFVANKVLRNMLGSNNLVVDFSNSTETMLELEETSSSVPPSPISSKKYITGHDKDKHKYKLSTQNYESRFIYDHHIQVIFFSFLISSILWSLI